MKYVHIVFCLLLVLFAAVQYNDPDGPLWMVIYLIPAFWSAFAAFRLPRLRARLPMVALSVCLIAALGALLFYWPDVPGWWRKDVWWEVETAREGMGVMVGTLALLLALGSALHARRRAAG